MLRDMVLSDSVYLWQLSKDVSLNKIDDIKLTQIVLAEIVGVNRSNLSRKAVTLDVLPIPDVFVDKELNPTAVLLFPDTFESNAFDPIAVFSIPISLFISEL